jgi:HD-GYP domain-containing protein (c-di-GMP phosphodiesterase class II)
VLLRAGAPLGDLLHRDRLSVEDALEELRRGSGTQFDPKVVEAFLAVAAEHELAPAA